MPDNFCHDYAHDLYTDSVYGVFPLTARTMLDMTPREPQGTDMMTTSSVGAGIGFALDECRNSNIKTYFTVAGGHRIPQKSSFVRLGLVGELNSYVTHLGSASLQAGPELRIEATFLDDGNFWSGALLSVGSAFTIGNMFRTSLGIDVVGDRVHGLSAGPSLNLSFDFGEVLYRKEQRDYETL